MARSNPLGVQPLNRPHIPEPSADVVPTHVRWAVVKLVATPPIGGAVCPQTEEALESLCSSELRSTRFIRR